MLENLDSVPWTRLLHAYGPATDVPGQIRDLSNPDLGRRTKALDALYGNIFHQGTRYVATISAVPFLLELVESEIVPDRDKILRLLASIAVGYDSDLLPAGIDPASLRIRCREVESSLTDEELKEFEEYGTGPLVEVECHDAVAKGVPTFRRMLDFPSPEIRSSAAYLLAWFPEDAVPTLERLQAAIDVETDTFALTNHILSAGLLAGYLQTQFLPEDIEKHLNHPSGFVRTAIAIAAAYHAMDARTVRILKDVLLAKRDPDAVSEKIYFFDGDLQRYACVVLSRYGHACREEALIALLDVLPKVENVAMSVTDAIMRIIIHGKSARLENIPFENLLPLEVIALRTLADYRGSLPMRYFMDYETYLFAYGLPSPISALRSYLRMEPLSVATSSEPRRVTAKKWWRFW